MTEQLELALVVEINRLYEEAVSASRLAQEQAGRAVEAAMKCGTMLREARDSMKKSGQWLRWLKDHCPKISWNTADRWIRLADSARLQNLNPRDHANLTAAYRAVGILPDPADNSRQAREDNPEAVPPKDDVLKQFMRVDEWFRRQTSKVPITQWSPELRRTVKDQLRPWVELYGKL